MRRCVLSTHGKVCTQLQRKITSSRYRPKTHVKYKGLLGFIFSSHEYISHARSTLSTNILSTFVTILYSQLQHRLETVIVDPNSGLRQITLYVFIHNIATVWWSFSFCLQPFNWLLNWLKSRNDVETVVNPCPRLFCNTKATITRFNYSFDIFKNGQAYYACSYASSYFRIPWRNLPSYFSKISSI